MRRANNQDESKILENFRPVRVVVEWGYEMHECPMALRTWKTVANGKVVRRVTKYHAEGQRFTAIWLFNASERGSLTVIYDDEGVGFEGHIRDADLTLDQTTLHWIE